jgi:NAD-dependent dihydropyrimidine dehydrogenase PreA subunit
MKCEYIKGVSTIAIVSPEKCTGCGNCVQVCPHDVFAVREGKALIVNKDACMECGACKKNCPAGVLDVRSGVGCAAALIYGMIKGTEPQCGCSGNSGKGGSCC